MDTKPPIDPDTDEADAKRLEPPTFMRHDEVSGWRFKELVETTFDSVKVELG